MRYQKVHVLVFANVNKLAMNKSHIVENRLGYDFSEGK